MPSDHLSSEERDVIVDDLRVTRRELAETLKHGTALAEKIVQLVLLLLREVK